MGYSRRQEIAISNKAADRIARLLLESEQEYVHDQKGMGPPPTEAKPKRKARKVSSQKGAGQNGKPLTKITANHRRFRDLLIKHQYDPIPAYQAAFKCKYTTASKNARALMMDPVFIQFWEETAKPMLADIEADKAYMAQEYYNLSRSNIADYFTEETKSRALRYRSGAVVIAGGRPVMETSTRLVPVNMHTLAEWQQKNIKKIKIKHTEFGQDIEFELYDRAQFIMRLGVLMQVFKEDGGGKNIQDRLDRINAAEVRRLEFAQTERQRRLDAGEMIEVDGMLIDGEAEVVLDQS